MLALSCAWLSLRITRSSSPIALALRRRGCPRRNIRHSSSDAVSRFDGTLSSANPRTTVLAAVLEIELGSMPKRLKASSILQFI